MAEQTIPVVDLRMFTDGNNDEQNQFSQQLGDALVRYGFVAVDNHPIDREELRAAYYKCRDLFALSEQQKQQYENASGGRQRGYTSFGKEHAKDQNVADLKEFWHVGPELDEGHALADRVPANLWPTEVDGFREATLELWNHLFGVGQVLLRAMARYLGADENEFSKMIDGGNSILRLIRYPGVEEVKAEPGAVWAAAHEDINLLTLLPEATEKGLELLDRDGNWLPIMPVPGQLICDSGDMFQRLTNGRVPSTTHRVLAPESGAGGPRYSMPFFIHPHPDYMLSPVASCVGPDHPQKWEDISSEQYLQERLIEIGLLEKKPAKGHGHGGRPRMGRVL